MESKRAKVLSEVLRFINAGDWGYVEDFIVFGEAAFWRYLAGDFAESSEIDAPLRDLVHKVTVSKGRQELTGRSTLIQSPANSIPDAAAEFISSISQKGLSEVLDHLRDKSLMPPESDLADQPAGNRVDESDLIDAALAESAIRDLDKASSCINGLDKLELSVLSRSTAAYFEEIHRCYAVGLEAAAVIMCRALLEDSLNAIVGKRVPAEHQPQEKRFKWMINEVHDIGKFDASRRDTADEIRRAGNSAVHNLIEFNKTFRARTGELVDSMRKILEDLGDSPTG
jgi:hypothetical protein